MGPEVEISHFGKSKMADGRHLGKLKNRNISVSLNCKSRRSKTANIKILSANSKHRR